MWLRSVELGIVDSEQGWMLFVFLVSFFPLIRPCEFILLKPLDLTPQTMIFIDPWIKKNLWSLIHPEAYLSSLSAT